MADIALVHRPALGNVKSGTFGASATADRIGLTALPEGHVLHVLASKAFTGGTDLLRQIGDGTTFALRSYGPGQWFVVGDASVSTAELAAKAALLETNASIADQSHGRVRIGIEGAFVEAVLAKGTAVDFDSAAFTVGASAMTLIGHVTALVTRTGTDSFELMVLRGFAESLWDDLIQMSLEFGVDATKAA